MSVSDLLCEARIAGFTNVLMDENGDQKMVKVCECCSNVDVNELTKEVGTEKVEVGCIGKCAAYKDKAYGLINDELVVEENSEAWINKAKCCK